MIKLPDFTTCVEIKYLMQEMGIEQIPELKPQIFERTIVKQQVVTIDNTDQLQFANDLKENSYSLQSLNINVAKDKTLEINGVKCCIYIKNQTSGYDLKYKTSSFKYHLCECHTIEEMISQGRKKRYVATSRDDGFFEVNAQNINGTRRAITLDLKLELCQNCKNILAKKGIRIYDFTLKRFYQNHQPEIKRTYQQVQQVPCTEQYAPDHAEVALRYKQQVGYTCQLCHVCCEDNRSLLHLHHKDGNGANNQHSNLQVLCLACHMRIHPHMQSNSQFTDKIPLISSLRQQQGIITLSPLP